MGWFRAPSASVYLRLRRQIRRWGLPSESQVLNVYSARASESTLLGRLASGRVDALKVEERMGHAGVATQRCFAITTEAVGEARRKAMRWKRETA